MFHFKSSLAIAMFSSLLLFGFNVQADPQDTDITTTTVTQTPTEGKVTKVVETVRHVVVTPAPAAKETTVTPDGYVSCFTVAAGWYNNVWIDTHQVCQYKQTQKEGAAWVAGYWACNVATTEGTCTTWEWKPGHWQQTLNVY
jgi:hypothetical protein